MGEYFALTEAVYYILLVLCRPQHGYGIMQETERLSRGRVRLAAGTLYGALSNLLERGWIANLPVQEGSRKKEYEITKEGRMVLEKELERLRELTSNGERLLKEGQSDGE